MKKFIITCGIPGSGKSFWAKAELKKDPGNWVRVNRDDIRATMFNSVRSESNEKITMSVRNFMITEALKKGKNVISDDTNLNKRNFNDFVELVKDIGIDCMVLEKPFYVDFATAKERNSLRTGSARVPDNVMDDFWKKSGGANHKFYVPRVETILKDSNRVVAASSIKHNASHKKLVISDLDGTLALFNPINKHGIKEIWHDDAHTRSPYDCTECVNDKVNSTVSDILHYYYDKGHEIFFITGRDDCYLNQTKEWLDKHVKFPYKLFMRKTGDSRKDTIVKTEIFQKHVENKYSVEVVLEDRRKVVDMWRNFGLKCFQVAPGEF